MIVNQPHHWFRLLFVWRGSVLHKVAPRLALVAAVSALSLWLRPWWLGHFGDSALSIPPFTLMGIALAIFLIITAGYSGVKQYMASQAATVPLSQIAACIGTKEFVGTLPQ